MLIFLISQYKNLISFISFGIVIINLIVFCFNLIKLKTTYDNKIKHKVIMIISIFMMIIFGYLLIILHHNVF